MADRIKTGTAKIQSLLLNTSDRRFAGDPEFRDPTPAKVKSSKKARQRISCEQIDGCCNLEYRLGVVGDIVGSQCAQIRRTFATG